MRLTWGHSLWLSYKPQTCVSNSSLILQTGRLFVARGHSSKNNWSVLVLGMGCATCTAVVFFWKELISARTSSVLQKNSINVCRVEIKVGRQIHRCARQSTTEQNHIHNSWFPGNDGVLSLRICDNLHWFLQKKGRPLLISLLPDWTNNILITSISERNYKPHNCLEKKKNYASHFQWTLSWKMTQENISYYEYSWVFFFFS